MYGVVYDAELTIDQVLTPFAGMNPTTWIKSTSYPELEFAPSLRAFTKQRGELLALLRPLPKAGWSRIATVTGAGKPREGTVMEYARWLANHERSHVKHIGRIVTSRRTARPGRIRR